MRKLVFLKCWGIFLIFMLLIACNKTAKDLPIDKLFTNVPAEVSGVTFENKILESERLHYYKYLYIYIGGGVAAADFNNDGLEDLFFTSNIYHNKLFLNKGDFKFEDITIKAGIEKRVGFDVGVSVADVNNDGFLDIYINRAGWFNDDKKLANMLYINNGDLTFTEQAKDYGIADTNRSIASTFFDYDKDGDLDLYVANAPAGFNLSSIIFDLKQVQDNKETLTFKGSDKLYENNGDGKFTDVSSKAGILPELGFGLNPQVGDLNNDGWPDIYVSNDFITPDFTYINNGDGTFTDKRNELFKHMSYYSMGSDIADVNNDGLTDLMVLDMSPEDYVRSKTTMAMMPLQRFYEMVDKDHHYQYMHNVMQINNGNGTYSEIANMSGVAKTDWSWAALLADFDLDGYNDIYVTNGIYRDVVDKDVNIQINNHIKEDKENLTEKDFYEFTQKLPQQKLTNYFFKNKGDLTYKNTSEDWVDSNPTFSNGAVYADLDNDGDLDVVVNNLDENATILKNNAVEKGGKKYLQLKFKGPEKNPFGVGAKVIVHQDNYKNQVRELINNRGYLSAVSNKLHFGLQDKVKKVEVYWPDGNIEVLENIAANQLLEIDYKNSTGALEEKVKEAKEQIFAETPINITHKDTFFNDFEKQLLLPHKLSQTGPALTKGDVNGDGLKDLFIGGGHNQAGQLLLSTDNGFDQVAVSDFEKDKAYEDVGATFFDADNDGDLDLYVVSGSYEFDESSPLLQDRLYINDGKGNFKRSTNQLPSFNSAGSIVVASDYDNDGDADLFVGGRVIPGKYPYAPTSYLLINENGKFVVQTTNLAPELEQIGMVTDAVWEDINDDGETDLIVTGEWMGIEVFINNQGVLSKSDDYKGLSTVKGWWNKLLIEDVDGDGDKDIVAGNLGLNYKFHASEEKPFHIYTNDFDNNGVEDIVLAKYYKAKQVPVRGKSCTSEQMPFLKEKVKTYNQFANSDLKGIFGENIESSLHYQVNEFRSGIFHNDGDGGFDFRPFAIQAQTSPINSILYNDFDGDGIKDLLMAGNNYHAEVETTRADAGTGVFLKGVSSGKFKYIDNTITGFYADKDVRGMLVLQSGKNKQILIVNNNDKSQLFTVN
ncbi:VCBS repeat-containing protein [Galbibacter sp. EGI 63066]|uniref:VCBS repeat-containing protein n=1 Tax=Galbibacter sp. EGI 63066 TaxID=2993559 RepID=UPI002248F795|nr:VCBS repeat-containing protein [Galbibacter sp. EGI 63066]MCX2679237.1 VCBS repeat-containing protein [Galbibacter sp. EGI 63066]